VIANLPMMRLIKFELIFNLKSANALGLTVPPTLLTRTNEAIEEGCNLLRYTSLVLAHSGHSATAVESPISGAKRTLINRNTPASIYEYTP
jgi:hypothetical protein